MTLKLFGFGNLFISDSSIEVNHCLVYEHSVVGAFVVYGNKQPVWSRCLSDDFDLQDLALSTEIHNGTLCISKTIINGTVIWKVETTNPY